MSQDTRSRAIEFINRGSISLSGNDQNQTQPGGMRANQPCLQVTLSAIKRHTMKINRKINVFFAFDQALKTPPIHVAGGSFFLG
ncbi:MAG: hypothetical protein AAFR98_02840 [Pseudomonadota bacterium]